MPWRETQTGSGDLYFRPCKHSGRTTCVHAGVSFLVCRGAPVSARPVGPAARRAGALRLYGVRRDHVHHGTRGPRHHGDLDRRLHRLAAAQDADLDLPPCRARARLAADGRLLSSAHHPAPVDTCPSPLGGHGLCATGRKLLLTLTQFLEPSPPLPVNDRVREIES